jgi:DeoR/GlpR family transcriptional regulator of sugar metabolism
VRSRLIQPGSTIFLDGSTTAFQMTRLLRDMRNLTVITTGLYAALELSFAPDVTTIVVGGILRRRTSSLVDTLSPKLLRRLHVDMAFLSCRGFTA